MKVSAIALLFLSTVARSARLTGALKNDAVRGRDHRQQNNDQGQLQLSRVENNPSNNRLLRGGDQTPATHTRKSVTTANTRRLDSTTNAVLGTVGGILGGGILGGLVIGLSGNNNDVAAANNAAEGEVADDFIGDGDDLEGFVGDLVGNEGIPAGFGEIIEDNPVLQHLFNAGLVGPDEAPGLFGADSLEDAGSSSSTFLDDVAGTAEGVLPEMENGLSDLGNSIVENGAEIGEAVEAFGGLFEV